MHEYCTIFCGVFLMSISRHTYLIIFCLLACLSIVMLTNRSEALSVTPLTVDLSAFGQNNKATLRVENDGAAPIAVEVSPSKLTLAEDGTPTIIPAKGKFLIFPPQAKIAPGASQSFRVQWLGDPNLKASESYLLNVNQLAVELDHKVNGIQLVLNFAVNVNIVPPNAAPIINVIKTDMIKGSSMQNEPVITLENSGNGNALLSAGSVVFTSGAWTKTLTSQEFQALHGIGLIQPGTRRRFKLAVPLPPEVSRYEVRVDLKRPR